MRQMPAQWEEYSFPKTTRNPVEELLPLGLRIAGVAAEQFVSAVPRERHSNRLASQLGNQISRNGRRVSKWLIEISHQPLGHICGLRPDDQFVVLGLKTLGHGARVAELAKVLFGKTD